MDLWDYQRAIILVIRIPKREESVGLKNIRRNNRSKVPKFGEMHNSTALRR